MTNPHLGVGDLPRHHAEGTGPVLAGQVHDDHVALAFDLDAGSLQRGLRGGGVLHEVHLSACSPDPLTEVLAKQMSALPRVEDSRRRPPRPVLRSAPVAWCVVVPPAEVDDGGVDVAEEGWR